VTRTIQLQKQDKMDYCTVCAGLVTNIRWPDTSSKCIQSSHFTIAQAKLQHLLNPEMTNALENDYLQ